MQAPLRGRPPPPRQRCWPPVT